MPDQIDTTTTADATPEITPPVAAPSPGDRLLNQLKDSTPTAPAADQTVETEPTPEPTFLDRLKEAGFQDVTDENEAKQRLLEAYVQTQQAAKEAAARAQELQELQRLRELEAKATSSTPTTTTATAPSQEPARPWQLPKVDEASLERYQTVTTDPVSGKETPSWIEGTPPEIKQQYADYQRAAKEWTNALVHEPERIIAAIKEELLAELPQRFEQTLQEKTAAQQAEQLVQNFKTENAVWLYKTDPLTKQPTGFSEEGEQFNKILLDLQESGIQDPQKAIALAMRIREAEKAKALATRATATDTNADKKRDLLLRGAGNPPSQGGSRPTLTDGDRQRTQNPQLSAGQRALHYAKRDGVAIPS